MLNWFRTCLRFALRLVSTTNRKQILQSWGTILFLVFSQAAMAQTGQWHVEEGGRIRISFDPAPRGALMSEVNGLIEVELEEGWKTYWRNPGSSGMVPELKLFDLKGDENKPLRKFVSRVDFPAPELFEKENGEFINGYQGKVLLPFWGRLFDKTDEISGQLSMGLCKDICLPVLIDFSMDVTKHADFPTKARIELAHDAMPKRAPRSFHVEEIKISILKSTRKAGRVHLKLKVPDETLDGALPQLFIHAENVQFSKLKFLNREENYFNYQADILSGQLESADRLYYAARLENKTAVDRISLRELKQRCDTCDK